MNRAVQRFMAVGFLAMTMSCQSGGGGDRRGGSTGVLGGPSASGGATPGGQAEGAGGGTVGGGATDGTGTGGAPPTVESPTIYEAEDGAVLGGAVVEEEDDLVYVTSFSQPRARVIFTVQQGRDGETHARLRYRLTGEAQRLALRINGEESVAVDFSAHEDESLAVLEFDVPLRAGLNTIWLEQTENVSTDLALDSLELSSSVGLPRIGAIVRHVSMEAEAAATNGVLVGPDRNYKSMASECSARKAVRLEAPGQFLEFPAPMDFNGLVLRYSIPDSADGWGKSGALSLAVDGKQVGTLPLSSRYAWVYGGYPYGNDPTTGEAHRFFDESNVLLDDIAQGAMVRVELAEGQTDPVTIDVLDLERVPEAYVKPEEALDIEDFGAIAGDGVDDSAAIASALSAGLEQEKVVWIPPGEFQLHQRIDVADVTLRGAGPWYSRLRGKDGKGGFNGVGSDIFLLDFSLFGDVTHRDDEAFHGMFDGNLGAGSLIQNLWAEHTKVGFWTNGGTDSLITGCKVHDTFADGVNLAKGATNIVVEHLHVRGTGDDGLAMWSLETANQRNTFRNNSVALPALANGIAVYGGKDNALLNNVVFDTITAGAGIAISTRSEFNPQPFSGITFVHNNQLVRTGSYEENWDAEFGAFWAFGSMSPITGLVVRDLRIWDSTYSGILFSGDHPVEGAHFENVTVEGAGRFGLEIATSGSATFSNFVVSDAASGESKIVDGFALTKN